MNGYTKIPNCILDDIMPTLTGNEFKVFMLVIRKTHGWNKSSDHVSLSQMKTFTGIKHSSTIIKCLSSLQSKNLIVNLEPGKGRNSSMFCLSSGIKNELLQIRSGIKNEPLEARSGIKNRHTKERLKKRGAYAPKNLTNKEQKDTVNR